MNKNVTEENFAKNFLSKLIGFSIPTWISFALSCIAFIIAHEELEELSLNWIDEMLIENGNHNKILIYV